MKQVMKAESRLRAFRGAFVLASGLSSLAGCSGSSADAPEGPVPASGAVAGVGGGGGAGGASLGGGGSLNLTVGGAAAQNPNADLDLDGYVAADDCDDGDPQSNPGAFDIPG